MDHFMICSFRLRFMKWLKSFVKGEAKQVEDKYTLVKIPNVNGLKFKVTLWISLVSFLELQVARELFLLTSEFFLLYAIKNLH